MIELCDCYLCRHPARIAFAWWQDAKEATPPIWSRADLEPAPSRSNVAPLQPARLARVRVAA